MKADKRINMAVFLCFPSIWQANVPFPFQRATTAETGSFAFCYLGASSAFWKDPITSSSHSIKQLFRIKLINTARQPSAQHAKEPRLHQNTTSTMAGYTHPLLYPFLSFKRDLNLPHEELKPAIMKCRQSHYAQSEVTTPKCPHCYFHITALWLGVETVLHGAVVEWQ